MRRTQLCFRLSLLTASLLTLVAILLFLRSTTQLHDLSPNPRDSPGILSLFTAAAPPQPSASASLIPPRSGMSVLHGSVIMKELGNKTIKAELGRSTWRLLHTMTARFPLQASSDEQSALLAFIHLLARLYPCGQCAKHFQKMLIELPPRVKGRIEASQWACEAHNIVNKRLEKEMFDCSKVLETWKCGCAIGEDGQEVPEAPEASSVPLS